MKRSSQSSHNTNEILEALAESIFEIDSHYKKVQKLKNLLLANQKAPPSHPGGSYANRYKQTHKKNTMSMRNLSDFRPIIEKTEPFKIFDKVVYTEPDESAIFIQNKKFPIFLNK